jgi:hypothetical protein
MSDIVDNIGTYHTGIDTIYMYENRAATRRSGAGAATGARRSEGPCHIPHSIRPLHMDTPGIPGSALLPSFARAAPRTGGVAGQGQVPNAKCQVPSAVCAGIYISIHLCATASSTQGKPIRPGSRSVAEFAVGGGKRGRWPPGKK